MSEEPMIQPPTRQTFPWGALVGGMFAIAVLAAVHFYRIPLVERGQEIAKQVGVPVPDKDKTAGRIEELNNLMATYRKLSMKLAETSGVARSNLLDDRTLIIARINTLIDLIPADKLPPEAHRFIMAR